MSETRARASRFAFWFGSFARKGLIGARRAGAGAPDVPPAAVAGFAGRPAGGALDGGAAEAGRCGNVGRSAVLEGAEAIGVVLETVGRIGEGDPPFAGPTLGAARPEAGAAGGTNGGWDPTDGPEAPWAGARGAPLAGGAPAGWGGRCAATPSGAVGTVAALGGTNGRGAPLAGGAIPPPDGAWGRDAGAAGRDGAPPTGATPGALGGRVPAGGMAGDAGVGRPPANAGVGGPLVALAAGGTGGVGREIGAGGGAGRIGGLAATGEGANPLTGCDGATDGGGGAARGEAEAGTEGCAGREGDATGGVLLTGVGAPHEDARAGVVGVCPMADADVPAPTVAGATPTKSSSITPEAPIAITPPQTEHRARTPA